MPSLFIQPSFYSQSTTCTTHPTFIRFSSSDISIGWSKLMPIFTMSFTCVYTPKTISHMNMLFNGKCYQMVRINAPLMITKMMDFMVFWYFSFMEGIRKSMSEIIYPCCPESTIPSIMNITIPLPTTIIEFNNMTKKYLICFIAWSTHIISFVISRLHWHYIPQTNYCQGGFCAANADV